MAESKRQVGGISTSVGFATIPVERDTGMKNVIFGAVAACCVVSAAAQQRYSEAVDKQRKCSMYGEMWREVKTSDTIAGKPLKDYAQEVESGRITSKGLEEVAFAFISVRADRALRTPEDAYMKGWAYCMDEK